MGIFESIFGGSTSVNATSAAAAPPPATSSPPPAVSSLEDDGELKKESKTGEGEKSPLDDFKDLFDTESDDDEDSKDGKKSTKPQVIDPFQTDVKKLHEVSSSIDFTKAISQDDLAKIKAGGEEAQTAFLSAMNTMAQMTYAYSAMHSATASKTAVKHVLAQLQEVVPDIVRNLQVSEGLFDSHPALKHPAAAPMIAALSRQISAKHPNKSSSEVRKLATDYLKNFASTISTSDETGLKDQTGDKGTKKGAAKETDWEKFLTS